MLASINPLGERARNTRWGRTVTWYVAGSILGGLLIGALAGGVGRALWAVASPSPGALAAAAAVVCLLGVALDVRLGGLRLPTTRRQVNEDWLARYRGWVYGGGFGLQLGLGLVTVVTTATLYAALVLAVLSGSLTGAIAIGGVFGLVRSLPILSIAGADDPARLRAVLARADRLAPVAARVAISGLALVAATSVAAFVL